MVWGPIGDRVGRVRALMLTILCYSMFTFICGSREQHLAARRAARAVRHRHRRRAAGRRGRTSPRSSPERQRKMGAGLMHTGYYFGFFFAAVANYFIGANYGWRWMFIFGGTPGADHRLHSLRRARVGEVAGASSATSQETAPDDARMRSTRCSRRGSSAKTRRHVRWCSSRRSSSCGPARSTCRRRSRQIARAARATVAADAARIASYGSMILAVATIIGCVLVADPRRADRPPPDDGAVISILMAVSASSSVFGYVFYLPGERADR